MTSVDVRVRARVSSDLPLLVKVLTEQQPGSRYPLRWPLPFPVERFIVRANEERAWVAESGGHVVGHVMVGRVEDAEIAALFTDSTGSRGAASISVLFVAESARGTGVGRLLLDTAVDWIVGQGRLPVLDVVPQHRGAVEFYRHLGWREVGRTRPDWLPDGHDHVIVLAWRAAASTLENGSGS